MPLDDTQGGELDLNNIVNDALGQEAGGASQNPATYTQDQGQGELLSRTPSQQQGGQPNQSEAQRQQLLAGKFKTPQELEKAYQSLNKMAGQKGSKLQQLESLIQNPRFQELASRDPDVAQALAKAGYELRKQEAQEDNQGQEWNGDENDPRFQIALIDAKNELRWNLFQFGQERGKALSQQEEMAIRQVLAASPRLSIKQAWKLTDHYDRDLKAKEDERMSKLQARPGVNRPRPNPTTLPGQKLDLKKPVTEMNDAERKAHLANIIEQNS